jgi:HEAT repeat protein
MPRAICCEGCGKSYVIRDEFLGCQARCSACDRVQTVPRNAPEVPAPHSALDSIGVLCAAVGMLLFSLVVAGGVGAWAILGGKSATPEGPEPGPLAKADKKDTEEEKKADKKDDGQRSTQSATATLERDAGPVALDDRRLYEKLLKSVVWIYGEAAGAAWSGSGAVIHTGRKLIITNDHCVKNLRKGIYASRVLVLFPQTVEGKLVTDKRYYEDLLRAGKGQIATVLHKDPDRDLAVIRLEGTLPQGTVAVPVATRPAGSADKILLVGNPGVSAALWVPTPGTVRSRVHNIDVESKVFDEPRLRMVAARFRYKHHCLETLLGTHGGDSGSPIVNTYGHLVAVHFARHADKTATLKYAADRNEVLHVLREVGVKDEEVLASERSRPTDAALEAILAQLRDRDPATVLKGVEALRRVEREAARGAIPALAHALQNTEDEKFRRRIVEEMERIGAPFKDDIDCLRPIAALSYQRARLYAVDALRQLGPDARPGIPVLAQALKDRDSEVRRKAATVLRDLGPTARPAAFRTLLETASDADEEVARAALDALIELGKLTPAEIAVLTEALGDDKRRIWVRRFAALRLGEQGALAEKAVPALVKVLQGEKDVVLLRFTTQALGRIGTKEKDTLDALLHAVLENPAEEVRLAALDALNRLDLSVFSTREMITRTDRNVETSPKVRVAIARLIDERMAVLKPEQMAEVLPLLQHKDPVIVLIGLNVILKKKEGAEAVAGDLIGLVKHNDAKVFDRTVEAFQTLGTAAKTAAPGLLAALKDVPRARRPHVGLILASIDGKNEKVHQEALPALIEGLHPHWVKTHGLGMRQRIQKALVAVGQPAVSAIFTALEKISSRGLENTQHRQNLYLVLVALGPDCKSAANYEKLRQLRKADLSGYEETVKLAQRALKAMDPN